MKLPLQE